MKKRFLVLLLLLGTLSVSNVARAEDFKGDSAETVTHEYQQPDEELDAIVKPNVNRSSGEGQYFISNEDWEAYRENQYKKSDPSFKGSVKVEKITSDDVPIEAIEKENNGPTISPFALSVVPSTGFPNASVGQAVFWYNQNGTIKELSGSVFKVNDRNVGTAGHCVYSHDLGGFATSGTVFFGKQQTSSGVIFDSMYSLTVGRTNKDWVNVGNFRSDFGAIEMRLIHGSIPRNLSLYKNPPASVNNVRNFGYPGFNQSVLNSSSGNVVTGSILFLHQTFEAHNNTVISAFGMSGGPLVNSSNQVIGINSYRMDYGTGTTSGFMKMTNETYNLILQ
ncbi:hypothetical protein C240_2663 [Enterococcus sp. 5H]|nr:hypothetical protein [Enterococcus sp. 5H]